MTLSIDSVLKDPASRDAIMKAICEPVVLPPSIIETLTRKAPEPFTWPTKDQSVEAEEPESVYLDAEITFLRDALEMNEATERELRRELDEAREKIQALNAEIERLKSAPVIVYEPSF
jgi:predicted RNase H-like nuclease (RuvC/YqgF family)